MGKLGRLSQFPVPGENHNWSAFLQIALVEKAEVKEVIEIMTLRWY